jgi:hypothetical protein
MSITQAYIDEHLVGIHDWDSWGRAIFERALYLAREKVRRKDADVVELNAVVRVLPVSDQEESAKKFCISVEIVFVNDGPPITRSWHTKSWHAAHDPK